MSLLPSVRHVLLLVWLVACWASPAAASTVVGLDLTALTGGSDAVVHAKVIRVQSRWTADRRMIVTDVELEVVDTLKGSPAGTVHLQQPGGVVGDVGQHVAGAPVFRQGEEVVVFLERALAGRFGVTGLSQGKFRVERSADGRSLLAVPEDTRGALLIDPFSGKPTGSKLATLPLEELKAQIRVAVKARP